MLCTAAGRLVDSTAELVAKLARGHYMEVEGVPPDFECAWRAAAFLHAKALQPALSQSRQKVLFDALELAVRGDDHKGHAHPPCRSFEDVKWSPKVSEPGRAPREELVEAANVAELLQHVRRGGSRERPLHIALQPGTYRLNETLVLGPKQSHITISPAEGEAVLTGSRLLDLEWTPSSKPGVWTAPVPADVLEIDALRVNGLRATRARYPNADPERDQFPAGYILDKTDWLPPEFPHGVWGETVEIVLDGGYPTVNTPAEAQIPHDPFGPRHFSGAYRLGIGGACSKFTPPESYWCQPHGRTAGMTYVPRAPAGIRNISRHLPHGPYTASEGMVLTYWRPGHWFSVMSRTEGILPNGTVKFGEGGFQGAEGHDTGAEWFVENVLEELDAPNEFYFDKRAATLHLCFNGTGPPPAQVEVPHLAELVRLEGGQDQPVANVTIQGVTLTGTRPTYLDPHGLPSAGDWGLARLAAIHAKGTTGLRVEDCVLERLDGHAVLLDGYNRDAVIRGNELHSLGASGVVLWGYEHDGDGTGGEQPRRTQVMANFCHEVGVYQKQSSCYFHAVSAQSSIADNLFFNGPRAMVNFNDGFGGGHDLGHNLIFNSCRESSDHGAFNSWGRQPYLTDVPPGPPTSEPLYSRLHNNFIVANYAADGGCFDNDDGSSWYLEQSNLCIYGGMKSAFQGHGKRSSNNLHAFASVYGGVCLNGIVQVSEHYAEGYWNNTCILAKAQDSYLSVTCLDADPDAQFLFLGNNKVYVPGGGANTAVNYCGKHTNASAWLAEGLDQGTVFADSASLTADGIVALGMAVLGAPNGPAVPPGRSQTTVVL